MCFEVDRICHEREKNEWFYYTHPSEGASSSSLFQPTMELKSAAAKYDGAKDIGERRVSINIASSSKLASDEIRFEEGGREFVKKDGGGGGRCEISSTPAHVVLQSLFNDMIGEFYSRTLLRLHHLMTDGVDERKGGNNGGKLPWEEDVQFYVHIPYGNKKLLDGHKLMLSGMLSNPDAPVARSLVDLFVQAEGAANGESGSDNDCQCYEKMVFCGYDVYTHNADILSKDLEPAVDADDDSGNDDDSVEPTENKDNAAGSTFNYDMKYTLWAAGKLDGSSELDAGICGRSSGVKGVAYECQAWSDLKNFISANFVRHYPTLERDIVNHRRGHLLKEGLIDKSYSGNTREFTVIGLTQRTYRRAWLDLPEIIERCNSASLGRAVCVEVNVENTSSPFEQLVLHRSLNAMIGVHGAQMTQGILLEPHAHVLELLPWITDYIREKITFAKFLTKQCSSIVLNSTMNLLDFCHVEGGKWVQTRHGPTPLGVIFHNTNLQHAFLCLSSTHTVGYLLNRSSVPMCEGVNEGAEQQCFMKQRKKFIWENVSSLR